MAALDRTGPDRRTTVHCRDRCDLWVRSFCLRALLHTSCNTRVAMAFYSDLSPYNYLASAVRNPTTRNVGWLAPGHDFATAEPSEALLDALWRYCKVSIAQTRGVHQCELCERGGVAYRGERHGETLLLGTSEIRVFASSGETFAAPTLIYHYVAAHHYAPPEAFVRALASEASPPSEAYFTRLGQLGLSWNTTSIFSAPPRKLWV
jgi:hypothetical protein